MAQFKENETAFFCIMVVALFSSTMLWYVVMSGSKVTTLNKEPTWFPLLSTLEYSMKNFKLAGSYCLDK